MSESMIPEPTCCCPCHDDGQFWCGVCFDSFHKVEGGEPVVPEHSLRSIVSSRSVEEVLEPFLALSDDRGRLASYALTLKSELDAAEAKVADYKRIFAEIWGNAMTDCGPEDYALFPDLLAEHDKLQAAQIERLTAALLDLLHWMDDTVYEDAVPCAGGVYERGRAALNPPSPSPESQTK